MRFVSLIIDSPADYARQQASVRSVLSLPLGTGTLLGHFLRRLDDFTSGALVLKTPGTGNVDLSATEQGLAVRFVDDEELDQAIGEANSTDVFLVFDTKRWPTVWPAGQELMASGREYRGATHAIAVGGRLDRATERIECDADGLVRRVHRLYETVNSLESAGDSIAYSLIPAHCLAGLRFDSASGLRRALAARGILGRDTPVACDVIDLMQAASYLSLSERAVVKRVGGTARGSTRGGAIGIFLGEGARVAASARLVPPVVVREGATIGDNAIVVGPSLIGPGGRVHREAIVAQSVVLNGAEVAERSVLRQQVYAGPLEHGTADLPPRSDRFVRSRETSGRGVAPVYTLEPSRRRRRSATLAIKRLIDVIVSSSSLVVLSPLFVLIGCLIKLDTRGPVFYGHVRERRGGKEFRCLKFRTMGPDADHRQRELAQQNQVDGPQFKLANDPRVTRIGRWLRASNLDELPQLINVLLGHMSLVGPRPSPFRENQICVAWRHARLSVRPGITGLWQMCRAADRSQGDFHEWIYYDLTYVRNFSLWLDLRILLATFVTLGGHRHVPMKWLIGGSLTKRAGYPSLRPSLRT